MWTTLPLLLACASPSDPPFAPGPRRDAVAGKNILVILLDDVATDRIGVYDEHPQPAHTPTIDALAAQGLRFTEAYAYPVCSPSRAALLTGRHGRRTGIGYNVRPDANYELPSHEGAIGEMLAAGASPYTSVGVGKWHLEPRNRQAIDHPKSFGFSEWSGSIGNLVLPDSYTDYTWYDDDGAVHEHESAYLTTREVDEVRRLVRDTPEPWFVLASLHAPHFPWSAPPPHLLRTPVPDGASDSDLYDAMLEAADTELARLLAEVDLDDTLVVLLGDNGNPKEVVRAPLQSAHGKGTMYEAGVRVPWIMAGAGITPGVTDELVHIVDLFPTFAEMSGTTPHREGYPIDGRSLWPLLMGEATTHRHVVFTEKYYTRNHKASLRMVRDDRYKLMERGGGKEGLHDLHGRHDDGPNLLDAPLDQEAQAAYDRLRQELTTTHLTLGASSSEGGALGCAP